MACFLGVHLVVSTFLTRVPRDGLLCRDTINRQGVEHEQARIGAAYTLGQAAKGGNTDALTALQVTPAVQSLRKN